MKNSKFRKYRNHEILRILLVFLLSCVITNCSTTSGSKKAAVLSAEDYYASSQNGLTNGMYDSAYTHYLKAVELKPEMENPGHLNNIILSWAISECPGEDSTLLSAQKKVWLYPQDIEARKELMSRAIDANSNRIHIFGVGRSPTWTVPAIVKKRAAEKTAFVVATTWVGRLVNWSQNGVEGSFDVNNTLTGVTTLKTSWLGEKISIMKVEAPLPGK